MGDQVVADHLLGEVSNLFGGLADLHSTLKSTAELALPSATSLDLSLEDETTLVGKSRCDLSSLLWGLSELTSLHVDAELAHDVLGLELVEIDETARGVKHHLGSHDLLSDSGAGRVFTEDREHICLLR